jgi:hypothetical protein
VKGADGCACYTAGVMCIAGHVNSADPGYSVYLEQCMYALGRWHAAFQLAGGKYLQYKLTLVTDRQRFERQKQLDAAFRTFAEHVLTIPVFFDDWVGTPNVALGKMKMPQSTKFQGFPQLWVHKFEVRATPRIHSTTRRTIRSTSADHDVDSSERSGVKQFQAARP